MEWLQSLYLQSIIYTLCILMSLEFAAALRHRSPQSFLMQIYAI